MAIDLTETTQESVLMGMPAPSITPEEIDCDTDGFVNVDPVGTEKTDNTVEQ